MTVTGDPEVLGTVLATGAWESRFARGRDRADIFVSSCFFQALGSYIVEILPSTKIVLHFKQTKETKMQKKALRNIQFCIFARSPLALFFEALSPCEPSDILLVWILGMGDITPLQDILLHP